MRNHGSGKTFEYDIALSFAGEDRSYVEQVAQLLRDRHVRVFYDEFAIAETWGADLYEFLDEVYRKKSRFAVVFISRHYADKTWTTHERQSAQARALNELGPYLLPVRLDDSELPGLRPTVGYVDARRITVEQLVSLTQEKLGGVPGETRPTPQFTRVPRTPEETRELLAQRPPAWEYLLYAGILLQRRDAIEHKWRDHELRYARRSAHYLTLGEGAAMLQGAMNEALAISDGINRVLDSRAQEAAFGAPGTPGDPERIEHLASRLIAVYEEFLDWAAKLRGMNVPNQLSLAFELAAQFASGPAGDIRAFVDDLATRTEAIPDRLNRGENVQIQMTLTVDVDDRVASEFSRELDRVLETLE